ncbi:kielin/chordin-like protein [Haliotis asinina]|uniref:kielin/chordin-like protein n=1 Tax=Haliotis asinina TaxID=109174 RepID=UPI0035318CA6
MTSICFVVFLTFVIGEVVPVAVPGIGGKENFIFSRICFDGNHRAVKVGHQWQDRCMKCSCHPTRGRVCETPKCTIPYKPYHNKTCARWSADGCCCEELGCPAGDTVYQIGQSYPFPPGDPCGQCLCEVDADHPTCTRKICFPPVCVDSVLIQGECCRRCLRGPNCRYPTMPGVGTATNRALRTPLLLSTSNLIQSDENPLMFYECKCLIPGGVAFCRPKPFKWLRGR